MAVPFSSSRRVTLAALAGVAVHGSELLAATAPAPALVCIRLTNPGDAAQMFGSAAESLTLTSLGSQERFTVHAALDPALSLYTGQALAVLREPSTDQAWEYFRGGFTAPVWMAKAVGATLQRSAGRAFTFSSGLLMLSPAGVLIPGAQLDNPTLLAQANGGQGQLPDTTLGRQLRQVLGLVANAAGGRRLFVVSLSASGAVGSPEELRAARYHVLGQTLASFQNALEANGLARSVVTFTEAGTPNATTGEQLRLVAGRPVLGGKLFRIPAASGAPATLATWAGFRPETLGLAASGERFVY